MLIEKSFAMHMKNYRDCFLAWEINETCYKNILAKLWVIWASKVTWVVDGYDDIGHFYDACVVLHFMACYDTGNC